MKRNYIVPLKYDITTVHPLFGWKYCVGCNKEVRRESMWNYTEQLGGWGGRPAIDRQRQWYGCKNCFHTKQKFVDAIDETKEAEEKQWEIDHPLPCMK